MPSQVFDAFVEVLELNGMAIDAAANRLRAMQRSLVQMCPKWVCLKIRHPQFDWIIIDDHDFSIFS